MNHRITLALLLFLLPIITSCDSATVQGLTTAAVKGNLPDAAASIARNKAKYYAANPKRVVADFTKVKKRIQTFFKLIASIWGPDNTKRPTPKRYVKYTHNYKSRASVDFNRGMIRVETLDSQQPVKRLQEAIVTTMLTPEDPGAVDLFSAKPVVLSGKPYLLGQVLDHRGQSVKNLDQAAIFSRHLTGNRLQKGIIKTPKGGLTRYYVDIAMVKDHLEIRAARYKWAVKKYAGKYGVSPNLVFSIIKTESNFNPFAVSSVPAFGLMQIVPSTAGRDTYAYIHGRPGTPSKNYLFNTSNNIRMGTAYLDLLGRRHLRGLQNPVSREYCMIAAYNGGIGRLLRIFSKDRRRAIARLNTMKPGQVYSAIRSKMPQETRNYIKKVVTFKKGFVGI
jgi:membrane-bound lytic murein transglycosylase C